MDKIRESILNDLHARVEKGKNNKNKKRDDEGIGKVIEMKFTPETFMPSDVVEQRQVHGGHHEKKKTKGKGRFSIAHSKSFQKMQGIDCHYAVLGNTGCTKKTDETIKHSRPHDEQQQEPSCKRRKINDKRHVLVDLKSSSSQQQQRLPTRIPIRQQHSPITNPVNWTQPQPTTGIPSRYSKRLRRKKRNI